MGVSVKCQYGLRALFELSRRWGEGLVRLAVIAEVQDMPPAFLENIMNQLRQGGFVESRRGKFGGFQLARAPATIRLSEIIAFIDGGIYTIDCEGDKPVQRCKLKGTCVFLSVWQEARVALKKVYGNKTLQDLLDADAARCMHNYSI
ncbi:MAG: Rrf2 family transcriptional regulator [Candidatus Desulfovibrio kirbyi]|uniref:Rrf2 family transcriptional regulator n=1 Tax=Candidatus Desulfovibrio kirbyi TaxID=2696086 RepID=A0A6L2R5F2_9BACT|nr:MAG: Rrf2 family transcriptional regulator [Candidatus Desulfovibrio kirbyi]